MTTVSAKLTKFCTGSLTGVMTTTLTLVARATLNTDLKLGSGTISMPATVVSCPPSPVPLRISIPTEMSALGSISYPTQVDGVSGPAQSNISAFVGAGTINNLKMIVLDEAFQSVDIYSNGSGGFHTLGGFTQLKTQKALINMPMTMTAFGDGDTAKVRKAVITIPTEASAAVGSFIASARINIGAEMRVLQGGTFLVKTFSPIHIDAFLTAIPSVATLYNLTTQTVLDIAGQAIPRANFRAKIQFTESGYVQSTITNSAAAIQANPLTDWLDQKTEADPPFNKNDYSFRAVLLAGTAPTRGNLLNVWVPANTNTGEPEDGPFWENTFYFSELVRTTTLGISLRKDSEPAVILATANFTIRIEQFEDLEGGD